MNATSPTQANHNKVILLHGLHMHAFAMQPLAKMLIAHGLDCHCFGYYSMMHPLSRHSERLNDWLEEHVDDNTTIHLVGHSLGGLVIRDFLHRYPNWQQQQKLGRIVTIGTPHNGSLSADRIVKILPTFIGKSYQNGLDGKSPLLIDGVEIGVIAGNKQAGLGQVIMKKDWRERDSDGTVFVSETQLPNATDHITLPHSHTGLIFSRIVAEQVYYFITQGKFKRP